VDGIVNVSGVRQEEVTEEMWVRDWEE
jgi:hypothetical protein